MDRATTDSSVGKTSLFRSYQGEICKILDGDDKTLESFTVDLFSACIIDELTKNEVMRTKGFTGANALMDKVRLTVEQDPQKLKESLKIMHRHMALRGIVRVMQPNTNNESDRSDDSPKANPQAAVSTELETHSVCKEETALLQASLVKPLCLKNKQQQHLQKRFEDHSNLSNRSFVVFQKYYQRIVYIICAADIIMSFTNSLCAARLVGSAIRDQVEKMRDNRLIQAKTVMGEVRTIIQRAVVPKMLMERFISVLNMEKFRSHFKAVIENLKAEDEEYVISSIDEHHLQRSRVTQAASIPACHDLSFQPLEALTPDKLPTDPYRRYLHILYQNLKTVNFGSSSKELEWKYFDLASYEQSVTRTNRSGEALDLCCLPQDSVYPPRTLITGAPGVGKSSIIIELCKRWVNGDLLQEYEYVIHLRACDRKVNNAKKVNDLVPEENQDWLHPITKANGSKCLFIVDGYDELSEECRQADSLIGRLIRREILNEAALIVTTRPWCSKDIAFFFQNGLVEILGFTPEGRKGYIQHFLEDDADYLLQQLTVTMEKCLNIPFYLATFIEIFRECKQEGKQHSFIMHRSVTKIYGALIRTLVLRFVKKHPLSASLPASSFDIAPGKLHQFPSPIYIPLLKLCILSYNSLSDPALLVPEPGSVTFGLLNEQIVETTSGRNCYYSFLHSSIGEYLAAYYISRMKSSEMEQCIQMLRKSKQYSLVLEFLHGFGCIQSIDSEDGYKAYRIVHNFDVLRQLCEADSCELIDLVYKNVPIKKFTGRECSVSRTFPFPTPADFWCLGRVIAMSDCDWYLGFTYRPIQNDHLQMLHEGIQSVDKPTGRIRKMALSLTNIDQNGLFHVFQITETCLSKLGEVQISKNHLGDDIIPLLCASLPQLPSLKTFFFHHNEVSAGKSKKLILALTMCRALEHVTFTKLMPDECQLLLTSLKSLKVVAFWHVSSTSCNASFNCLPASKVEQLEIHESYIDPICVRNLPETLPASRVQHLKLINCGINCATVEVIAVAAARTIGLQSLDLSDNCIEDRGGTMLLYLCWLFPNLQLLDSYKFNDYSRQMYHKVKNLKNGY